jgi:hypothetical protein
MKQNKTQVDILFGFAYDERVTMGDGNCESAWTV